MTTFTEYAGGSLDGLKQNEFVQLYKSWLEEYVFNDAFWEEYGEQFAEYFQGDDWDSYFDIAINQNGDLGDEDGIAYPYLVLKDLALLVDDADLGAFTELLAALNEELGEMFADGDYLDVQTGRTTQERTYFDSFELKAEEELVYYDIDFEDGAILGEDGEDGVDGEQGDPASRDRDRPQDGWEYFEATPGEDGAGGTDGDDALIIEDPLNYDAIRITSTGEGPNQILGGSGGDGGDGGDGGEGLSGGQVADGADGGDGGNGGQSGHAIVNGNDDAEINTIVIEGDQDLTILGGTGGAGGSGGDGGGAATGNASAGEDGEDGLDGAASAAFSHRVDVDATGLDAHLTISGSDFDDTFVLGDAGSDLHATRGVDEYTLGDGQDIIRYTSLARNEDGSFDIDTLIGFDVSEDQIDISGLVGVEWGFEFDGGLLAIDLDNSGTADLTIQLVGVDSIGDEIFIA